MSTSILRTIVKTGVISLLDFAEAGETDDWQFGYVPFEPAFPDRPGSDVHVILTVTDTGLDPAGHFAAVVGVVQVADRYGFHWALRNSDSAAGSAGCSWMAILETPGTPAWREGLWPHLELGRFAPRFLQPTGDTGDWQRWEFADARRERASGSLDLARVPAFLTASNREVSGHNAAAVGTVRRDPKGEGFALEARNSDCKAGACSFSYVAVGPPAGDYIPLAFDVVEAGDVHALDFAERCQDGDWRRWDRISFKYPGFFEPPHVLVTANGRHITSGVHNAAVVGVARDVTRTGFYLEGRNSDSAGGLAGFDWVAVGLPGSDSTWHTETGGGTGSSGGSFGTKSLPPGPGEPGAATRRLILGLLLLPPGLLLLDFVAYFAVAIPAGQDLHAINQAFGIITDVLVWGGALALGAAWLLGLLATARRRRWRWFALVLLVPYVGALLYSLRRPRA